LEIKNSLLVFLSYALGLVLLGGIVIARFPLYATAWFVLYIVAGIFQGRNKMYDLCFFLVNAIIGLVLLAFTGKILLAAVSVACAYGFFVLSSASGIKKLKMKNVESKKQREQIKQIIKEVVSRAKAPELEVVSYGEDKKEEPKPKASAKPKKKAAKKK
jgi:hypothetical protein